MGFLIQIFRSIIFAFLTGFSISIPLGPSALESVSRSISKGFIEGFKVSLGAVLADFTILLIVNIGLLRFLINNNTNEGIFWIFSGILLSLFNLFSNKCSNIKISTFNFAGNKYDGFISGYIMTILNPTTIFLWIAISSTVFSIWIARGTFYFISSIFFMFVGSLSWFAILNLLACKGVRFLKRDISKSTSKALSLFLSLLGVLFIIYGFYKILC
ncbi:MAG: LysE family translocator [Clostridium sp.]